MTTRRITSVVDESAWDDLRTLAKQSNQRISVVLTEAIREYVQRRRTRPDVLRHLEESILDNQELGRLLAR